MSTLVELLRQRAASQATQVAFEFLAGDEPALTFAELDQRARKIAAELQARAGAGERALLVYPPGLEFVAALFGCLYAGWVAVPVSQQSPLAAIAGDAAPILALTTSALLERLRTRIDLTCLASDALPQRADACDLPRVAPDDLAILQYTSGSTAAPRGVMLSHANLVHNTRQIARRFEITSASRGVIWLPPFHDMGLIGGILQGVQSGFPIALMSPAAFARRPARWLQAISERGATISGGPNFAYDLCVERVTPEERARLDLSSWEVAFNGAEPVQPATLARFSAAFADCGFRPEAFYPCYGLAEATLMVSGGQKSLAPTRRTIDGTTRVSCGSVIDDQELLIVDPETGAICADGSIGEIRVRGPSVALGYWRQPELTREVFGDFLRTGDLGSVHDGELYVTGRLKSLLFVGGRKLLAEDVERTVSGCHTFGWPGGVAAISDDADRELVVLHEVGTRDSRHLDDIVHAIRLSVAEQHRTPVACVVLVRPGQIPRTSSGKVRRDASRAMVLERRLEILHEWRLAPRP